MYVFNEIFIFIRSLASSSRNFTADGGRGVNYWVASILPKSDYESRDKKEWDLKWTILCIL